MVFLNVLREKCNNYVFCVANISHIEQTDFANILTVYHEYLQQTQYTIHVACYQLTGRAPELEEQFRVVFRTESVCVAQSLSPDGEGTTWTACLTEPLYHTAGQKPAIHLVPTHILSGVSTIIPNTNVGLTETMAGHGARSPTERRKIKQDLCKKIREFSLGITANRRATTTEVLDVTFDLRTKELGSHSNQERNLCT